MSEKEKLQRFDQLMLRHKGLIVKVCQIYCRRDVEMAHDLYQDIAVEIWTHLDSFREESSEATWLWRIAVNTAIDKLRAEERRPKMVLVESLPEEGTKERPQRMDDLYEAIAHLKAEDQRLVAARLEDRSYKEIAAETGENEGALRVRYNRIVNQLRKMLKGK
jgi:RNA polymerase sigma-70 factor (ECF subfamily)